MWLRIWGLGLGKDPAFRGRLRVFDYSLDSGMGPQTPSPNTTADDGNSALSIIRTLP